jgi:Meiotically Up-regulated Gene 113 (MUG113) protein
MTVQQNEFPEVRRLRTTRVRPPDGLLFKAEAAAKLGCSIMTLDRYVKIGALPYVALGHGKRRQLKRFTDADLDAFIANQRARSVVDEKITSVISEEVAQIQQSSLLLEAQQSKPPYIYIIGAAQGPVKIGVSVLPVNRLRGLQTGNPYELGVLAQFHGGKKTEAKLHAFFAQERLQGEWFQRSPRVRIFIGMIVGGAKLSRALKRCNIARFPAAENDSSNA